jgi:alcohol oxidase
MAPRENKGVVDASCGVHGIKNLKLADLSIPPENVGANTGGCAFVVGERAADIFIKELGLGQGQGTATLEKRKDSVLAERPIVVAN